jgi:hypothetical protein
MPTYNEILTLIQTDADCIERADRQQISKGILVAFNPRFLCKEDI